MDRALLLAVALSCAGMSCFWSSDGDLGFHLATGREVLATGQIPTHNVLSYTQPTQAWRLHQWLPGVLFEWVYRRADIAGLIALKMLVVALLWSCVYRSARVLGARPLPSAFACVLAATASAFRFELRPYLFTHLTLALTQLALAKYARSAQPRRMLGAAVWIAACAFQLHAGALDSVITMGLFALGCALEPLRARGWRGARWVGEPLPPAGWQHARRWLLATLCSVLLAAAALALYHPLGPRILTFPFEMGRDRYLAEHLVEFRTAYSFPFRMLAAYWLCLGVWLLASLTQRRLVHIGFLLIGLTYAALSLHFVRMVFAFAIVSAPCSAQLLGAELPRAARIRPWLAAVVVCSALLTAPLYVWRDHTPGFGYEPRVWPMGHFRFIQAHALQGHAFISDVWAGPFLGVFYPRRRVFFDDRLEAYTPQFVRDVYQHIRYARPGWDGLLDDYGVEIVLLRYTTPAEAHFQVGEPNLRQRLAADPRYALLRFDDEGELFVRSAGANAALAQQLGLPGVDPDRRVFLGSARASAPRLLAALQRGERSATMFGMTAIALADRGQRTEALALARQAATLAPHDPWVSGLVARLEP